MVVFVVVFVSSTIISASSIEARKFVLPDDVSLIPMIYWQNTL